MTKTSKNYVTRKEMYKIKRCAKILDNEKGCDHKIILDKNVLRWEENTEVSKMF